MKNLITIQHIIFNSNKLNHSKTFETNKINYTLSLMCLCTSINHIKKIEIFLKKYSTNRFFIQKLPLHFRLKTLIKSPHNHKKSRDQFQILWYKRKYIFKIKIELFQQFQFLFFRIFGATLGWKFRLTRHINK